MRLPLLACLLSGASLAQEPGVYRYTGADGEAHYTNDLGSLPGDVVVTPVQGESLSVLRRHGDAQPQAAGPPAAPTKDQLEYEKLLQEVALGRLETARAEQSLQRGALEAERFWRGSFRRLYDSLRNLQAALEREEATLQLNGLPIVGSYQQLSLNCGFNGAGCAVQLTFEERKLRIKQLQREMRIVEEDLAELERRASFAGVPHEWRR